MSVYLESITLSIKLRRSYISTEIPILSLKHLASVPQFDLEIVLLSVWIFRHFLLPVRMFSFLLPHHNMLGGLTN